MLTGNWEGTFTYPDNLGPATPFLLDAVEVDGQLSGMIIEPDTMYDSGETMRANIVGHRGGRGVDFTKVYGGQRYGYENPVDYVGQLSSDGQSVTGMWSLLDFDGTFEMYREIGAKAELAAKRSVDMPEPAEQ